ncbi:MAG TPA: hypothetical protein DCZ75_05725 [Geobacter sp.]|nr:hypothetical protein [Geobacter sp.]
MKLLRLALLSFPKLPQEWEQWGLSSGAVRVETIHAWKLENCVKLLVVAGAGLKHKPKVTAKGLVVVPPGQRKELEAAIEHSANLVSISANEKRSISSPSPCIAFLPETEDEKEWLARCAGIMFPVVSRFLPSSRYTFPDIADYVNSLSDRRDGIALMAEALAHGHTTGKFHEYIRLFERAFRLSSKKLIHPLSEFLSHSNFGFSNEEVQHWVLNVRHPATHADERDDFILERDVFSVIGRVEQAAYDVLFNKESWRNQSSARRALWAPPFGTTSVNGDMFLTKGQAVEMVDRVLDEFAAYPMDLGGVLKEVPAGWWTFKEHVHFQGAVKVLPGEDDQGTGADAPNAPAFSEVE